MTEESAKKVSNSYIFVCYFTDLFILYVVFELTIYKHKIQTYFTRMASS